MDKEKVYPFGQQSRFHADSLPDLRLIRESTGKTLRDIAKSTRIRTLYLEAIEKGDFKVLPEPIYAETFIKTYAGEIGVDEKIILSCYRSYLSSLKAPVEAVIKEKKPGPVRRSWKKEKVWLKGHVKVFGWILSALVAIGFLISFFISYTDENTKPEIAQAPVSSNEKTPAAAEPAGKAATPQDAAPAAEMKDAAKETPSVGTEATMQAGLAEKNRYRLIVQATEMTWLNIAEDDNPPYEILLRPGERMEREASEKFLIDIGNAAGVDIQFQGKSLGRLGKSGQVVHLVLPGDEKRD